MRISLVPLFALFTLIVLGCAHSPRVAPMDATSYNRWIQFGTDSSLWVRAVTPGSGCPKLEIDHAPVEMQKRATAVREPEEPVAPPVLVCEKQLPAGAREVSVDGVELKLPPAEPKRIVVLGDTGCRIKGTGEKAVIQPCNLTEFWPFATVAKSAAAWRPDLVIHVGDYHYRESPCPPGENGCEGSVEGDVWESWDQDFFTPAKPLLEAAPWVFVRGNHESCKRGGEGWTRILDPAVPYVSCAERTPPYAIRYGGLSADVIDSSDEGNVGPSLRQVETFPGKSRWLLSHRPLFTPEKDPKPLPPYFMNRVNIELSLVGHVHQLSINTFKDGRPPEIVTGNGGDDLAPLKLPGKGFTAKKFGDFGFLTMEKGPANTWDITAHDRNGKPVVNFKLPP